MKPSTPRDRTRDRLRKLLDHTPGMGLVNLEDVELDGQPVTPTMFLDSVIEAVLDRSDESLTVYAVLITRDGKIEGADVFDQAHPDLGEAFQTAPLFSTSIAVRQYTERERSDARFPFEEVAARDRAKALDEIRRVASEKLSDPRYNWIGPISTGPARAFLRDATLDPARTPDIAQLRDRNMDGWTNLQPQQPDPVLLLSVPRLLADALTQLRAAVNDQDPPTPDAIAISARSVLAVWQQTKIDRETAKALRRGYPGGMGAASLTADAANRWAEPGMIWAELVRTHGNLACVKVPRNCRVVDPSWPHGATAERTEVNAEPVHALEDAAASYVRTVRDYTATTVEGRAQARAALQLAAFDLSLMVLDRCGRHVEQCNRDGWLEATETLRRFQRRADQDAHPNDVRF